MSPMIDIVFLSFQNGGFETPPAVYADEFKSVGVDTGVSTFVGDDSFAIDVRLNAVDLPGTEGVAFLCNETFVVSIIGFVGASEDDARSDVAAYEPSSIAAGGFERK